jgi:ATP phosphoribosyltransferase
LLSLSPHAVAVDLFQTGETLTADKLNDIDQRIMALETFMQ